MKRKVVYTSVYAMVYTKIYTMVYTFVWKMVYTVVYTTFKFADDSPMTQVTRASDRHGQRPEW